MTSATTLLQRAVLHERTGELQASEETLTQLLRQDPHHGDALHLMGGVILKQQRPADALIYLKRAFDTGIHSPSLLSNLGATCRQLGQFADATMYYTKAIELDPNYVPAWFNLGILHERDDQLEDARRCYEKTIALDPKFSAAHNNLASLLPRLGGSEELVLQHQQAAAELKPQNASYHQSVARTLFADRKYEESLAAFEQAIKLAPKNPDYLVDCGVVLNTMDRHEEALAKLEQALELDPRHLTGLFNSGKILHNRSQFKKAAGFFRRVLEVDPNHESAVLNLAKCEREFGQFEESEKLFKRYLELTGNEKVVLLNLAFNKFYQQQLGESEELINKALAIDPRYVEAIEARAQIRRTQENWPEERDLLRQVCLLKPKDVTCRFLLASCHYKLDEYKSCQDRLLQILNLDDTHFPTWFLMGNLWGRHDTPDKALECYHKVVELCPHHASAHSNIAEMARGSGDLETAKKHFDLSLQYRYEPVTHLKKSVLIPPIIESREQILETRRQLEVNLDEMITNDVQVHPDREVAPTMFYLAYHGMDDRKLLEKYAQVLVPSKAFKPSDQIRQRRPDGRIRLGLLSHHFKNHTIGNLNLGLIEKLNRSKFHITVFSQMKHEDVMGKMFQQHADEFVHLHSEIDVAVGKIQERELDILHYPDLGMDPFTFSLAHLRLAPVQTVSWGHPVTSGSPVIDYYISTELIDDADAQQYFTEELVRFKTLPTYFYFPGLPKQFDSRTDLGLPEEGNLYVCPQSLFKFHPDMDDIFAGILDRDPNGYIVLIDGIEKVWNDQLRKRYQERMPETHDRILFINRLDHFQYMSLVFNTDVMLDPLPFGGGNTSYQALGLGIPIVTCPPVHQRGRFTQGLYRKIGVTDCIVDSYDAYVDLCIELTSNREKREAIQQNILMANDILFEEQAAVAEFEEFFERIVRKAEQQ